MRIDCEYEGEVISAAKPILGSMHRGAEKLFESRDYRQVIALANRHEWLSAYSGEVGVAQLVETALGIEVPDAAQWFRTLLLEYNRVTSHLAFLAGFPWQDEDLIQNIRKSRELWVNHYRVYTGSRMHPMLTRIGGLTHSPSAEWLEQVQHLCFDTAQIVLETNWLSLISEYESVGVLTKAQAIEGAVSGPVARASPTHRRRSAARRAANRRRDPIEHHVGARVVEDQVAIEKPILDVVRQGRQHAQHARRNCRER